MNDYIGVIRMFGGNFAPVGYLFCHGQLLEIGEYEALFTLIGTIYGGDGQTTFALPNLQSRIPIGAGNGTGLFGNYQVGETFGSEAVSLTSQQLPFHGHEAAVAKVTGTLAVADSSTSNTPAGLAWGPNTGSNQYVNAVPDEVMGVDALQNSTGVVSVFPTGAGSPHANIQPYLTINYIICTQGIFPRTS